MAMTVSEAVAVNVLLDVLYGDGVPDDKVLDAACVLAGSARKRLGAGWYVADGKPWKVESVKVPEKPQVTYRLASAAKPEWMK